jgi:farnesyl-diphosphate farnesyltransferase
MNNALEFQTWILPQVSRTFALTIPQLPEPLVLVVSNAYLLCRIADTIEDDPQLNFEQKTFFSNYFIDVVSGKENPQTFAKQLTLLLSKQTPQAEHDLIQNTPLVIEITHNFNVNQQAQLIRCIRIMSNGMAQFQRTASLKGLKNVEELNQYCYVVAGVVGEMLAALFCDYSQDIAKHQPELEKLSVSFGQGLQMTNILKDIADDRERGICWLPREIFGENIFDHQDYNKNIKQLVKITCDHLQQAMNYIYLIPKNEKGIRKFCLWAVAMAVLTLRKIAKENGFYTGQQVKISRTTVKMVIFGSNLLIKQNKILQFLFEKLTYSMKNGA